MFHVKLSDWIAVLGVILAAFVGVILPAFAVMIRGMIKWTRVETKLDQVIVDMQELVRDKDRVHQAIQEEIRWDRDATDKRLRWLEEYVWRNRDREDRKGA